MSLHPVWGRGAAARQGGLFCGLRRLLHALGYLGGAAVCAAFFWRHDNREHGCLGGAAVCAAFFWRRDNREQSCPRPLSALCISHNDCCPAVPSPALYPIELEARFMCGVDTENLMR
jgi:hypothetical protein